MNHVSKIAVSEFKGHYCDENQIIPCLLLDHFDKDLIAPILDVGAGMGDIAYNALAGKEAILLEVNPSAIGDYPLRAEHRYVVGDFFEHVPVKPLGTLLISHTLQFIDDDRQRLDEKIAQLAPRSIVLVLNSNDGIMGDLVAWSHANYPKSNPEKHLSDFPQGYKLVKSIPFRAQVTCPDYATLARQVAYLTLVDLGEKEALLISFLRARLSSPSFALNQTIKSYVRA